MKDTFSLRRLYIKAQEDKNEQKEFRQAVLWQTKSLPQFISNFNTKIELIFLACNSWKFFFL